MYTYFCHYFGIKPAVSKGNNRKEKTFSEKITLEFNLVYDFLGHYVHVSY